ncbi:biliverdin-producing heme oxygenase [Paenibacillus sp. 1P07SE]|uniref:biliverdin-producing heme oxygenase n=1 Tax=Paenibacillus sp. 1P07SE TaxID=3132209 RepID=UPI0039A6254B
MSTASTILTRLKEETAPMHEHIEKNEYAAAIMNNSLSMEKYKDYLMKFYGFIKPWEARLHEVEHPHGSALSEPSRNKTKWLEQDLTALGVKRQELDRLPLCDALPDLTTRARALGSLYVLEGSTLGGQMIAKKLAQVLPVDPQENCRYFYSYGPHTRERWQEFRQELEEEADTAEKEEQMIAAARETFVLLDCWITGREVPAAL